jgi:hypothetical protein
MCAAVLLRIISDVTQDTHPEKVFHEKRNIGQAVSGIVWTVVSQI